MLLGNKKKSKNQNSQRNWCLIINPLKSDIDRNKIAKKIEATFNLSFTESLDLVANTPIILLDNLPYETAIKAKKHFQEIGTELVVSNDNFLKRRCYKTVWPEPPSLSFLLGLKESDVAQLSERLDHEEAIREIRSWRDDGENITEKNDDRITDNSLQMKVLEEEKKRLIDNLKSGKEHLEEMKKSSEKMQSELFRKDSEIKALNLEKKSKEKENQEMQALLSNTEEKHEILREEFRDTRDYFEERLSSQEKREEKLLKETDSKNMLLTEIRKENQILKQNFQNREDDFKKTERNAVESESVLKEKISKLTSDLEAQKGLVSEWNMRLHEFNEFKARTEKNNQILKKELNIQVEQSEQWKCRAIQLEEHMEKLRKSFENQEKTWKLQLMQADSKQKELESARKQIRELNFQLEHREALQKKAQLAENLGLKEDRLKNLVKQQEKAEKEIREREEEMRKLLAQQEVTEREIIEDKQAQRHLLERTKKTGFFHS